MKQKARTRRALLAAATQLMREGRSPTIVEVADAVEVSRATAYRYFPTQDELLFEAGLDGVIEPELLSIAAAAEASPDVRHRVTSLVDAYQKLLNEHEAAFRTLLRLSLEAESPTHTPRIREGSRMRFIQTALAPAAPSLPSAKLQTLAYALTVCIGEEARVVLRDICDLDETEAEAVIRWATSTLVDAVLADSYAADGGEIATSAHPHPHADTSTRPEGSADGHKQPVNGPSAQTAAP